jgi:hypothetical protein
MNKAYKFAKVYLGLEYKMSNQRHAQYFFLNPATGNSHELEFMKILTVLKNLMSESTTQKRWVMRLISH